MIAYVRFKVSSKGILWTRLEEGFTPSILNFFVERYPLLYIMLEYKSTTYVKKKGSNLARLNKPVEKVVEDYEKVLDEKPYLEGLNVNSDDLWGEFYDSQYIKQRKNHKLFHHYIPKYLKNIKGLKKEFDSLNESDKITSFIKL